MEELTKKEQIINFAQNDPFLKISDIAKHVQTTPRYVRTILSEANISLMKLRERYARSIEERLEEKEIWPRRITMILKEDMASVTLGPMEWEEIRLEEDSNLNRRKPLDSFIRLRQKGFLDNNRPFYWLDARAYLEKDQLEKYASMASSMEELLQMCGCQKIQFSENRISLVQRSDEPSLALKLERDICWSDFIIGRETRYYLPEAVELMVPGEVILSSLGKK